MRTAILTDLEYEKAKGSAHRCASRLDPAKGSPLETDYIQLDFQGFALNGSRREAHRWAEPWSSGRLVSINKAGRITPTPGPPIIASPIQHTRFMNHRCGRQELDQAADSAALRPRFRIDAALFTPPDPRYRD